MDEPGLVSRLMVPVVLAALATGLAWAAGLDGGHVALVGIGFLIVGGAPRVLRTSPTPSWPEPVEDTSGTGCHLVPLQARLVHECEGDRDRFERSLAGRLRALAAGRLHAAGHDPAAVRELLGPDLFDPLRPGRGPRRPAAYVTRLLDRLDELDPAPDRAPGPSREDHPA